MFQSTSSATATFAGNPATITLGTNSSSRIVINSSGNVGIGTINPSHKLDIHNSPLERSKKDFLDLLFSFKCRPEKYRTGLIYDCLNLLETMMIKMEEDQVLESIQSLYKELGTFDLSVHDKIKIGNFLDESISQGWIIGSFSFSDKRDSLSDPKFEEL